MKPIIILLVIVLFASCKENSETLLYLSNGMKYINNELNNETDNIKAKLVAAYYENKSKTFKIKQITDSISFQSEIIYKYIDSIVKLIISKNNLKQNNSIEIINASENTFKIILLKKIAFIQTVFLSKINQSEKAYHLIEKNLQTAYIEKENITLQTLQIITHKIKCAEYTALYYFYSQIQNNRLYFNKILPVVIPSKKFLKRGEIYRAEIFPVVIDTSFSPSIFVESDKLTVKNGIAHYKYKPLKLGNYHFNGVLKLETPYTHDSLYYPFKISFTAY